MVKQTIIKIEEKTSDASINIALSTIKISKQAIIFVNTKRSAESLAEKIALKLSKEKNYVTDPRAVELSEQIRKVLPVATKQCNRLSELAKHGMAFHHSGLLSEQRELIEQNFRSGIIKIIVATPTLAIGVDLPAFRVIIRDLKRYGLWGMQYIPVLEYEQQSGRAGRPSFDKFGEAICVANTISEKDELMHKYILGSPEEIVSKLAVEPIMRTYILSLVASGFINKTSDLESFFNETFYAQQYHDARKLNDIIYRMLDQLEEWKFITVEKSEKSADKISKDFVSALKISFTSKDKRIEATLLGKRVSELYLDPYTANFLITHLEQVHNQELKNKIFNELSLTHLICSCLELRPLLRVKTAEFDIMQEYLNQNQEFIITQIPEMFDEEYEDFIFALKTTKFFMEWLDEKDEEYLLEKYDVRPGEISAKKDKADWLLYSIEELCRLMKMSSLIKDAAKLRFRLKYGAREELIPLLRLKNIGRVRARIMFNNKVKDISDVKKVDLTTLTQLIGKNIALDIKRQVGEEHSEEKVKVKENKRKGQINLDDFDEKEKK